MIPVQSSNIDAIDYDPQTQCMLVRFKAGTVYSYQNVEAELFVKIWKADSVGSAFHSLIKSNPVRHPYTRVH